jgi:hypothetical protein
MTGNNVLRCRFRQILILMFLFLAGCAGQGLDPEKKQDKASEAEATKATAGIDDAKCQSFGFQPGSPGYAECRKGFDNEHKLVSGHE